jgi:quaternary ammonium compound-resistance protein SugE
METENVAGMPFTVRPSGELKPLSHRQHYRLGKTTDYRRQILVWIYLGLAVVFEIGFALSMKASDGFTVFWPSVGTVLGMIASISLLTLALRTLPISVGYPIWVGAGALGTVIFGTILFGEAMTPLKAASAALIVIGVIGLKVASG